MEIVFESKDEEMYFKSSCVNRANCVSCCLSPFCQEQHGGIMQTVNINYNTGQNYSTTYYFSSSTIGTSYMNNNTFTNYQWIEKPRKTCANILPKNDVIAVYIGKGRTGYVHKSRKRRREAEIDTVVYG